MRTGLMPGVVIVSPLVFGAAPLRWASEEWLQAFVVLARSLGRPT